MSDALTDDNERVRVFNLSLKGKQVLIAGLAAIVTSLLLYHILFPDISSRSTLAFALIAAVLLVGIVGFLLLEPDLSPETEPGDILRSVDLRLKALLGQGIEPVSDAQRTEEGAAPLPGGVRPIAITLLNLLESYEGTSARIRSQISALSQRGTVNMLLGIGTTLAGIFVLGYAVYTADITTASVYTIPQVPPGTENTFREAELVAKAPPRIIEQLLAHYIPRLSLAVFIQVFAYFFLRLYKSNLAEIKYFQNEMTNVESRFLAVLLALHNRDPESFKEILGRLSATDRNLFPSSLRTEETTDKDESAPTTSLPEWARETLLGVLRKGE